MYCINLCVEKQDLVSDKMQILASNDAEMLLVLDRLLPIHAQKVIRRFDGTEYRIKNGYVYSYVVSVESFGGDNASVIATLQCRDAMSIMLGQKIMRLTVRELFARSASLWNFHLAPKWRIPSSDSTDSEPSRMTSQDLRRAIARRQVSIKEFAGE